MAGSIAGRCERDFTGSGVGYFTINEGTFTGNRANIANLTHFNPQGLIVDDAIDRVVLSTIIDKNVPSPPAQAQLIVYNRELLELTRYTVLPGLQDTGALFISDTPGVVIGLSRFSKLLYRFDIISGTLLTHKDLADVVSNSWQDPLTGCIYVVVGPTLYTINKDTLDVLPLTELSQISGANHFCVSGTKLIIANTSNLFTFELENPTQHLVDRSAEFGTPPAAGAPTACVIPGLGVHNIAYRDTSGRLHELWRDAQGATGTTNLTANAGAPTAAGNPFAYVDTSRNTEILLFRGGDGTVRSLYWSTGPVGHDNLSGTAGAPKVRRRPGRLLHGRCRYPSRDLPHRQRASPRAELDRRRSRHLRRQSHGGDLGASCRGRSTAFVNAAGINIVVYRSVNGHILSLYWADGPAVSTTCPASPAHLRPQATRWPTTRA